MSQDLFTIAGAARYVGVSRQAVEQRIEKKEYTPKETAGVRFVERWWLDAWKAERRTRGEQLIAQQPSSPE